MTRSLVALCAGLIAVAPAAMGGQMPSLIAETELPLAIQAIRAAPDGKRALALVSEKPHAPTTMVAVLDFDGAGAPKMRGSLAVESRGLADLAIATDGRTALLKLQLEAAPPPLRNSPYRQAVVGLAISNTGQPAEVWRREVMGRNVVLAGNASAYAITLPADEGSRDWEIITRRFGAQQSETRIPAARFYPSYSLQLSSNARYLAYVTPSETLAIIDLQSDHPVVHEQDLATFSNRHECLATVLDTGHALIEDSRTPRLGVYAAQPLVPRIAKLSHLQGTACRLLGDDGGGHLTFASDHGLRRIDVRTPESPKPSGDWLLPAGTEAAAVAGQLLYAIRGEGRRQLALFRLDKRAAPSVDWPSLEIAVRAAVTEYTAAVRERKWGSFITAVYGMERAEMVQAIGAAPRGISRQRAAAILNDYGFLAGKWDERSQLAEAALRRAMELDPRRALAPLNLSELLKEGLKAVTSGPEKQKRIAEIERLYRHALALGAEHSTAMDAFMDGKGAREADVSSCQAIAALANGGQLQEHLSDTAIDVEVGKRRMDLLFGTAGTAHVPVIYPFDAETDFPLDDSLVPYPGDEMRWDGRLALFAQGTSTQILHYLDLRHPVESIGLSGATSCKFGTNVVESVGLDVVEPVLCVALLHGNGPASIELTEQPRIANNLVRKINSNSHAEASGRLDFMNDGRLLNVLRLGLIDAGGPTCAQSYYDLLNDAGDAFSSSTPSSNTPRALLLRLQNADPSHRHAVQNCGNDPRFFRYEGKVYFETKPAEWPPEEQREQYHRVTRIEGERIVDVCDFRFESTVTVR